jgi:hypothetical protein
MRAGLLNNDLEEFWKEAVVTSAFLTDWATEESGFESRLGQEFFFFPQRPDCLWGPPNLLCNGYRG